MIIVIVAEKEEREDKREESREREREKERRKKERRERERRDERERDKRTLLPLPGKTRACSTHARVLPAHMETF